MRRFYHSFLFISFLLAFFFSSSITAQSCLQYHYSLDNTYSDSMGNGVDMSSSGGPAFVDSGLNDSALYFDGNDDRLEAPFDPKEEDFTITLWAKFDNLNGGQSLFELFYNYNSNLQVSRISPDTVKIHMLHWVPVGFKIPLCQFDTTQWHHFALSIDNSSLAKLYLDGELRDTGTIDENQDWTTINIGVYHNGVGYQSFFNGLMNDFRYYNCVLDSSTIYQQWNDQNLSYSNGLSASISEKGDTLFSDVAGGQYQWLDCDSGYSPLTGENDSVLLPKCGKFALEVYKNGCLDTSACITSKSASSDSISTASCGTYVVPSGDTTYTSSGIYEDTLTNSVGCDSIITIDLTISDSSSSNITEQACNEYTVPSGDETYTSSGTYEDTIPNDAGCDSIITIDLTINTVDTSVTTVDPLTLEAVETGASYQWLDCDEGYVPISGETYQQFTASSNGNYAVEVTKNGCTDTSSCYTINSVGIAENEFNGQVNVHPNPTKGKVRIEVTGHQKPLNVTVRDVSGRRISEEQIQDPSQFKVELGEEPGIYMVRLRDEEGKDAVIRVVKE